ncbi:MAG: Gfo/Idh/MocA family oxidoreductase [Candidatus Sumerlaeia bacterium]|nr:Gfo/Idh/MocA family oxidoreductase [Candidatus Sumerlaeia bacterium]
MSDKKIRAAVIGVGHLGQHHARNYAQNPRADLLYVCDSNKAQAEKIGKAWNAIPITDPAELVGKVDAVSIATPTVTHFDIGELMLKNGIHCLIEKPVCDNVVEAAKLAVTAARNSLILQVGHIEHFNMAVQRFMEILTTPRFIECHRIGPFNPRVKDVGVVMDLMIHDIDIILRIVQSEIKSIEAVGIPIVTEREDIANARIVFESGCIANITVSRVTPKPLRKLRVFQDDAYVSLDYAKQAMEVYRRVPNPDYERPGDARFLIESKKLRIKREEPLMLEIDHFLDCVQRGRTPRTDGTQAMEALDVVIRITELIRQKQTSLPAELLTMPGVAAPR